MDINTTSPTRRTTRTAVRVPAPSLAIALALVAPTCLALAALVVARQGVYLSPQLYVPATIGMLLGGFGPHPASLWAVWTQDARANLLRGEGGLRRAMLMPLALLGHPATRAVVAAQLAGLVGGLMVVVVLGG